MKRRSMLKLMGLSAVVPMTMQKALADQADNKNFLLVLDLPGGWDTTLGLDPWTNDKKPDATDLFIEYSKNELLKPGGIYLGPSAAPIAKYSADMAVINGVFLSEIDNGHDAAEKYMLTGGTGAKSSMVLSFADAMTSKSGLGVLTNSSLIRATARASASSVSGISRAFSNKLTGGEYSNFANAHTHSSPLVDALRQMVGNSPNMKDLFKRLENANYTGDTDNLGAAQVVASAFSSNSSQFAQLKLRLDGNGFDTHSSHEGNHLQAQKEGFEFVAKIVELFKNTAYGDSGQSLFDKTTIMVTSEFSRTAALNNAKGKDHNPMTNSVLLLGNGIKGNQTIGASRLVVRNKSKIGNPYQIAMPYDFSAGEVVRTRQSGAKFITPTTILRTLCDIIEIQPESVGLNANTASLTKLTNK